MENDSRKSLEVRVERLEKALFRIERVILRRQKKLAEEKEVGEQRGLERAEIARPDPFDSSILREKGREHLLPGEPDINPLRRDHTHVDPGTAPELSKLLGRQNRFERILEKIRDTEDWFNKIGTALLLLGLAFLFKHSVDQGWLTPVIRVLFGAGLGAVLLSSGYRLYENRRRLSLFLLGAGIVSFYITCFGAYQILGLIPFSIALGIMIAITVTSFFVSAALDEAVPALIACLGGFATPFLLYTESSSVPGLMAYVSLMIVGSVTVYWFRGWRPLLWLSFVGAGIVLLITVFDLFGDKSNTDLNQQLSVQFGIVLGWLVYGLTPIAREVVSNHNPLKLRPTLPGIRRRDVSERTRGYMMQRVFVFIPLLGTLSMVISVPIWQLDQQTWGVIILAYAIIYGLAGAFCWSRSSLKPYAPTHGFAWILFLTVSLFVLFENIALLLALTFEVMILHALASRYVYKNLSTIGHVIDLVIIFLMIDRFSLPRTGGIQIISVDAATDLGVLACGFLISRLFKSAAERKVYAAVIHAGVLAWLLHELSPGQNGQALVSISWGIYASLLLVLGLRKNVAFLRKLGIVTLGLIVFKLFLIDLARLEMIWKVIVFMGFGGGFLLLSYFFRSLWGSGEPGGSSESGRSGESEEDGV